MQQTITIQKTHKRYKLAGAVALMLFIVGGVWLAVAVSQGFGVATPGLVIGLGAVAWAYARLGAWWQNR
jgi:apolipoprotein N-acyltransferase